MQPKKIARQPGAPSATASADAAMQPGALENPVQCGALVHVCGHCEKRFRSPGKLVQHERVHATTRFYCSFCHKTFVKQSTAAVHCRYIQR